MARNKLLALAEARIFQAVILDRNGVQENVVIYVCGTDAFIAKNLWRLFSRDSSQVVPKSLLKQVNAAMSGESDVKPLQWDGTLAELDLDPPGPPPGPARPVFSESGVKQAGA